MEKVFKMIFVVVALSASALLGVYFGMRYTTKGPELGGVNIGNDYQTYKVVNNSYVPSAVLAKPGAIGQLTVVSSTAGQIEILDANGTATSSIAVTEASLQTGTYVFDRALHYGLMVSTTPTFVGQYVISYR